MRFQTTYICGKCKKVIYQYEVSAPDPMKRSTFTMKPNKQQAQKAQQRIKSHKKKCGNCKIEINIDLEPS